jgi:rhodanese-related sulfurtransferase
LGAQAFGKAGVEKRIDVIATAIHGEMTVDDLAELDLAYAPPYSSANDPLNIIGFVAGNDISGYSPIISATESWDLIQKNLVQVIDVRTLAEFEAGHLAAAIHIPVDELRDRISELDPKIDYLVHCAVGYRGHLALRILKELGFQKVRNITGGWSSLSLV